MTRSYRYDVDLVGGSLMVRESRIVAGLLLDGANDQQWDKAILEDNLLQKRTPAAAKRNARTIRKRLEKLEPEFWRALKDGDDELSTQIAFCGALERNLLLVEFLETVVRDAFLSRAEHLALFQWFDFLDDRINVDPEIFDWKESTRKKTGQVVFRMLSEVGILANTRSMELRPLFPRPELRSLLDQYSRPRILKCLTLSSTTA